MTTVASTRADHVGWQVVKVATTQSGVTVRAIGPLPLPDSRTLRTALDANGLSSTSVQLELEPIRRVDLPGRQAPRTSPLNGDSRPALCSRHVTRTLVALCAR